MTDSNPVDLPDFDIDNEVIASLLEKLTLETQIKDAFPDEVFDSPDEVFTILQSLERSTCASVEGASQARHLSLEEESVEETFEQCSDLLNSHQIMKDCFLSSFGLGSRKMLEAKNSSVSENYSRERSFRDVNKSNCDKLSFTAFNFPPLQTDDSNLKSIDSLHEVFQNHGKVLNFDLTTLGQNDSNSSSFLEDDSQSSFSESLPSTSYCSTSHSLDLNYKNSEYKQNKDKLLSFDFLNCQPSDTNLPNRTKGIKRPYPKSDTCETQSIAPVPNTYSSLKRSYTILDKFNQLSSLETTDIKSDSLDSCSSESNSSSHPEEFHNEKSISSPDSGFHDACPESPSGSYVLDLDNTSDEELQQIIEAFFDYESLCSDSNDPPVKCFGTDSADYDQHIERIVSYLQTPAALESDLSVGEKDSSLGKSAKSKKFKLGCRIKYAIKNGKELRQSKSKNSLQCNKILKQIQSDEHIQKRIKVFQLLNKKLKRTIVDDRENKRQKTL